MSILRSWEIAFRKKKVSLISDRWLTAGFGYPIAHDDDETGHYAQRLLLVQLRQWNEERIKEGKLRLTWAWG